MDNGRRRRLRKHKEELVLKLFRSAIPPGELDKKDWDTLRVAARLVYETEDLRKLLCSKRLIDRDFAISYWIDSMESGIEFMRWARELASIVKGPTYASNQLQGGVEELWQHHRVLALRLRAQKLSPERRLSLLVELGGLELSLLGQLWWLEPSEEASSTPPKVEVGAKHLAKRARRQPPKKPKARIARR